MKKSIVLLALALTPVFLLPPEYCYAEEDARPRRFKLGVIVPLSGDTQAIGKAHRLIEGFVREAEEDFEETVQVVYEDSLGTTAGAIGAFNKLVEVEQVQAVYATGAEVLPLLAPFAEEKKVPFFSPEVDVLQANGRHYTTLFRNEAGEFVRALWEQLRIDRKKHLVVFKNQDPGLNALVRALSENAMAGESVRIVSDQASAIPDFKKPVEALKKMTVEFLGVFLLPPFQQGFMDALRSSGQRYPLLGLEPLLRDELNVASKELLEGALMVTPYVPPEFRERFKAAAGSDNGAEYGVEFYDFLSLLNREVGERDQPFENSDQFLTAMRFQGERRGIVGPMAVKMTSQKGVYFSHPIAVYRLLASGLIVQRLFERPR